MGLQIISERDGFIPDLCALHGMGLGVNNFKYSIGRASIHYCVLSMFFEMNLVYERVMHELLIARVMYFQPFLKIVLFNHRIAERKALKVEIMMKYWNRLARIPLYFMKVFPLCTKLFHK